MNKNLSLKWFKFTKYIRLPIELFINLVIIVNIILYINDKNEITYYTICVLANFIFMFIAFIKLYSQNINYYKMLIFSDFIKIYIYCCVMAIFGIANIVIFLFTIISLVFALLEWSYFNKRSDIYNKENIEPKTMVEDVETSKALYCKKCGTKLDSEAKFCRKCGERII